MIYAYEMIKIIKDKTEHNCSPKFRPIIIIYNLIFYFGPF